jgi:hypothetical protein
MKDFQMATQVVTQTLQPRNPVAFRATLGYVEGIAMRDHANLVHFLDDATAQWQTLQNSDASRLQLHGRLDLVVTESLPTLACSRQNVEV